MQLHRADVLRGALELLDRDGLDALTVRALAAQLGVRPGALYWHFASKQSLIDAMADELVGGVADHSSSGTWEQRLVALAHRYRAAITSHRDGARVVAGAYSAGPHTAASGQAFFAAMRRAGVPTPHVGWAWWTLKYYILGHCIEEQSQARLAVDGLWPGRVAALHELPSDQSDDDRAALAALVDSDPAEQFDFGLVVVVDGIRAGVRRATRGTPPPFLTPR